jgi:hypothetical protein
VDLETHFPGAVRSHSIGDVGPDPPEEGAVRIGCDVGARQSRGFRPEAPGKAREAGVFEIARQHPLDERLVDRAAIDVLHDPVRAGRKRRLELLDVRGVGVDVLRADRPESI